MLSKENREMEGKKMTREEIKRRIDYILDGAWENPQQARYYLEKLPKEDCDYDVYVEDYIVKLEYQIHHQNKEYFDIDVEDLVEHYYENQQYYTEFRE